MLVSWVLVLSTVLVIVVAALLVFQSRLIYFPVRYDADFASHVPEGATVLRFHCAFGDQVAFYIHPRRGGPPSRVWLVWGGNGMVASRWIHHFVRPDVDARDGFLLIDYPGYGACAGSPSPATILAASEAAAEAIAAKLGWNDAERATRFAAFGHSLGAGSALQFVARHPVSRVVLVSPFTDLTAMARRMVGSPLCYLLHHRFDNRARLREVLARDGAPPITIIHGGNDETIPVEMGRALAREFPSIRYDEVAGADHNGIIDSARDRILAAMAP
ncbi:MAG: alpha/beta fold hydrolase [Planctomycetes bacterium]|nr:alpha/beta fold hydrolase [Planctomycetota bacterium]